MTQNETTPCQQIDPELTRASSLKVLANMADQYEHGDASLKQTRGFYLRKMFNAIQQELK